jgi:uncharacterized protein (DUF924 family)
VTQPDARPLLAYWFEDLTPKQWFTADDAVDATLHERFGDLPDAGLDGRLEGWTATADGALALVLVLDQLPRNLYRGTARAFAYDAKARDVARQAVGLGFDHAVAAERRVFFYLPFEHSEALADQDWSVALMTPLGNDVYTDYALRHRDVISRFGRFPHRNAALGRISTAEEKAYLAQPGAGF